MIADLVQAYEDQTDEELYSILGAGLLGPGLGIDPNWDRVRRFGRAWLDNKVQHLWQRIHESETYRIWAETAGPGQAIEANIVAEILSQQGEDESQTAALAVLLERDKRAHTAQIYDIAVSFADGQRNYVEQAVTAAKALDLRVFYDRDMTHQWWGRNFITEQRKIYGHLALHFVPFISTEYLTRKYPRDEFSYAMLMSVERGDDYILPILVGDVHIPPELLHPHVGYLRADDHTPKELAWQMRAKVDAARARAQRPRDFGAIVHDAHME